MSIIDRSGGSIIFKPDNYSGTNGPSYGIPVTDSSNTDLPVSGNSLMDVLGKLFSLTMVSEGDSMYSSNKGDFSVIYSSATEIKVFGLPYAINSSNIRMVLRKPSGSGDSIMRVRGAGLVVSYTQDTNVAEAGTITFPSSWFASDDEIEVIIDAPDKAYDRLTDTNKVTVTNSDARLNGLDGFTIGDNAVVSSGDAWRIIPFSEIGYHKGSLQIASSLGSYSIKIYGSNTNQDPQYNWTDGAPPGVKWHDITLEVCGTEDITEDGCYSSLESVSFRYIMIVITFVYSGSDFDAYRLSFIPSAM